LDTGTRDRKNEGHGPIAGVGNTFREMASLATRGLPRDWASRAVRAICAI